MKEVEYREHITTETTFPIMLVETAWAPFSDDTMTSRNGVVQLWDWPAHGHVLWFCSSSPERAVFSIEDIWGICLRRVVKEALIVWGNVGH